MCPTFRQSNCFNSKENIISATSSNYFQQVAASHRFRYFMRRRSVYLSWNVLGEITVWGELELTGVPGPVIHNLNVS